MWSPMVPLRVTQTAPTHLSPLVFGIRRERTAPTLPQATTYVRLGFAFWRCQQSGNPDFGLLRVRRLAPLGMWSEFA